MVILKKVNASTLMETLVASVLIVVIFMLSSMILNNLYSNTLKRDTRNIEARLDELYYRYNCRTLTIPYQDDFMNWHISIFQVNDHDKAQIVFEAFNNSRKKTLTKTINENP